MLYLVCDDCGEAFDATAPEIAYDHADDDMIEPRFYLRTEDEAM